MTQLRTVSGIWVDILDPKSEQITLHDIAHQLSLVCRFGGAIKEHYSVAAHSIWVSHTVPPEHALQGLLHDAAEAYLGDMPTPLKNLLPEYKKIEQRFWEVIANKFNVPVELAEVVKEVDQQAYIRERAWYQDGDRSHAWEVYLNKDRIASHFIERFVELNHMRKAA